jgi:hypothetical protein
MKVKVIFIGQDRRAYAEDIPSNARMVELRDGYHPVDGVRADARRRGPPLMVIWHGTALPEGVAYSKATRDARLLEVDVAKMNRQRSKVSRAWWRRFSRWGVFAAKTIGLMFLAAFLTIILVVFF